MSGVAVDRGRLEGLKEDPAALLRFFQAQTDGALAFVLGRFGRLQNGHSRGPLLHLLETSGSAKVRALALMNLAKLGDVSLLDVFVRFAKEDASTEVRREAVSAMGRLRNAAAIPFLLRLLADQDPKVVMQAIRGLLVFQANARVGKALAKLGEHPNEQVRELVAAKAAKGRKRSEADAQHADSPAWMANTIVQGDTLAALKHVPDEAVHLTFTSPPYYNARDYSIYQSYGEYLQFLRQVFQATHRVTKEGRFFVLNTSPIIIPRISRAHASRRYPIPYDIHPLLIELGWEFIDDIVWVKPESSVKNRNAGFLQHRKPLGYKPNAVSEMLMVYRKRTDKLIDWNLRQYPDATVEASRIQGEYETTNVWHVDPASDRVHSAVFPVELCNRVIRYYSFAGDLVFDPFGGSGTVARAAMQLGRRFFLTEREPAYVNRMKEALPKRCDLFNGDAAEPTYLRLKDLPRVSKQP